MSSAVPLPCEDKFVRHILDMRLGGRYQLDYRLGSGTFGMVYLGRDVETGEEVALKLEHHSVDPSLIAEEVFLYECLATRPGFPEVLWHGQHHDYNIMVLNLLGPNLGDLLSYCGGQFSLKTTLMLADQLLTRFETLHAQEHLHRDTKPENFLMGSGRQGNVVCMIDLGLAMQHYSMVDVRNHIKPRERQPHMLGTCRYASINGHYGGGRSYGDDLESLGYMLIYFIKGRLPWQGIDAETEKERYNQVGVMKQAINTSELCKGLPSTFEDYMRYVQSLSDSDRPDYRRLRRGFRNLFKSEGFSYDNVFDWTLLEYERLQDRMAETTKGTEQRE